MSDLQIKPIHTFFRVTISSIKYTKNTSSDILCLHVYNNSSLLRLLGYCETNATISPTVETAYRVNNILKLLDICQLTFFTKNNQLIFQLVIQNKKQTLLQKTFYFKPTHNKKYH